MFGDNTNNNQTNGFSSVNLPNNSTPAMGAYNDPNPPAGPPINAAAAMRPDPNNFDSPYLNQGSSVVAGGGDLIEIKRQALSQLSPLIGQLDQTPEEKFRTTMMMIQASDNQDLIKEAYAAAQAIPDTKARAQALLDVINEINYFAQKNQQI